MGSSLRSGRDCRWGEWITSTLSTLNTMTEVRPLSKAPNPQLLPFQHSSIGCPLLQVYVHYCVCTLGWVKCRAQILSMGHHTWPHTTSLSPYIFNISLMASFYDWRPASLISILLMSLYNCFSPLIFNHWL